jgi:hypothetical protein
VHLVAEDAGSPSADGGGIFDNGLDAYRTVTDDDYRSLFTSGLIVLDANVLLNLYRYHAGTRAVLIEILTRLKDRLWVPYQAMSEFHEGRASVIASRSGEANQTIDLLNKNRLQLEAGVGTWANRIGLPQEDREELISSIGSAVDQVASKIREQGSDNAFKDAEDTAKDPVITALTSILERSVGKPLSSDELRAAKREAQQRIADNRPPGWKDAKKRDNPEGDYLVWLQTLQEAKRRGADVLFVTGDVKEDWWRKERGEAKDPLPELANEMRVAAGVRLFMLRPESLLVHAGKVLGIDVSNETVQDAERVTAGSDFEWPFLAAQPQIHEGVERLVLAVEQLGRWHRGTDTYAVLAGPATNLESAARGDDPKVLLNAVWSAVQIASASRWGWSWTSNIEGTPPANWEQEVWAALAFVYLNAVYVWLEEAADRHMQINTSNPEAPFLDPLPPGVINVEVRLVQFPAPGETPISSVQFIASVMGPNLVAVQRRPMSNLTRI